MENQKMEDMLSQLIKMVGTMHSELNEMKTEMHSELNDMKTTMHSEQNEMKSTMHSELNEMKTTMHSELKDMNSHMQAAEDKNETRHKEIIDQLKVLENDQDFIWEKSVRNERKLANIKRQLSK